MKKLISVFIISALVLYSAGSFAGASYTSFSDVQSGTWYTDAVGYATEKGLFNGTTATTFSPQSTMTRGMFVSVLGRYANVASAVTGLGTITKSDVNMRKEPTTESGVVTVLDINTGVTILGYSNNWYQIRCGAYTGYVRDDLMTAGSSFTDVAYGTYYCPYIQWACSNGITTGTSSNTFSPDVDITREEICSMLYNYALKARLDITPTTTQTVFADNDVISSSYSAAVYAMQQLGVVNGRGGNLFAPTSNATRAEVAVMLMRFIENAGYNYSMPVPEGPTASSSYFNDACFIGHSLVVGMKTYSGLSNPDYMAVNGISAQRLLTYGGFELSTTHTGEDGSPVPDTGTIRDVLLEKSYGKVYIMLGTNELGPETSHLNSYYNSMSSLVDIVRQTQPNAQIYLISIPPVSKTISESSVCFNRENVLSFNTKLFQVALEKKVYYLDIFNLFADAEGYMPDTSCMSDGIHLLSPQYGSLLDYLNTHAI